MAQQGILSLSIKDRNALYKSYMPFVSGGGLFVPSTKRFSLGDEVFLLLTVMEFEERLPIPGKVLRSHVFAENVLARGDGIPLFRTVDIEKFFDEEQWRIAEDATSLLVHLDVVQFLTSPAMWAGVLVCGLLSTGAIYVRRFRDES